MTVVVQKIVRSHTAVRTVLTVLYLKLGFKAEMEADQNSYPKRQNPVGFGEGELLLNLFRSCSQKFEI